MHLWQQWLQATGLYGLISASACNDTLEGRHHYWKSRLKHFSLQDLRDYEYDQGDSIAAEAFAYTEQHGLKRKRSLDGDDLSDLQGSHTHYGLSS